MVLSMNAILCKKSNLNGTVVVPPSKSHTVRAILLASIAKGTSLIKNMLPSKDLDLLINHCTSFGAQFFPIEGGYKVIGTNGQFSFTKRAFDVGNSGIALRFLSALLAHSSASFVITGDHSIQTSRPIKPLLSALCQMKARAQPIFGDYAPCVIEGPVHNVPVVIDGSDSQYVSALLFASLLFDTPFTLHINEAKEIPFIELSLHWLHFLNIPFKNDKFKTITVYSRGFIDAFEYTVPADFSSASYPIALGLISDSCITLENLNFSDVQGDKELIDLFCQMGGDITIENHRLICQKSQLHGMEIDCDAFIDAIPLLAVIGCFAKGKTVLKNAKAARYKECDRIHAISTELKKLGARIEERNDGLVVYRSKLRGGACCTYNDHRMVLSLSVLGLTIGGVELDTIQPIEKTYLKFFESLKQIGAQFETEQLGGLV
jgi:3-phosphoshikimate 1-carboxyvinyltransferase